MVTDFDKALKKLIIDSGLPLKKFAEATETSSLDTLKWWNSEEKLFIKDSQINSFQNFFAITIEDLLEDESKISLLRKRVFGDRDALPEKYENDANSFVRSTYYILKYLRMLYGQAFVDQTVLSLDVHPLYLDKLDNKINIRFLIDLLNKCKELGFKQQDFQRLSGSLFLSIENSESEDLFSTAHSYEDIYNSLSLIVNKFDHNFDYDFVIGKTGADLITRPTEKIKHLLDDPTLNSEILFSYRPMLFSQAPLINNRPGLDIKVKSCTSRGDSFSRYQVHFPDVTLKIL